MPVKQVFLFISISVFLIMSCAAKKIPLAAGNDWLSKEDAPVAANINGTWTSNEWGDMTFTQSKKCREVTGSTADGWKIDGVVAGKKIFLIFSHTDQVVYSAILKVEPDKRLVGGYVSGALMVEGSPSQPMELRLK